MGLLASPDLQCHLWKPDSLSFSFPAQVLLKDLLFAALVDRRLNGTVELLANFLYNGPPDQRPPGSPPYDWRDLYNATTRVLGLLANFLGVSSCSRLLLAGPG